MHSFLICIFNILYQRTQYPISISEELIIDLLWNDQFGLNFFNIFEYIYCIFI